MVVVIAAILLVSKSLTEEECDELCLEFRDNVKTLEDKGYTVKGEILSLIAAGNASTVSSFEAFLEILEESVTMEFYYEGKDLAKREARTVYSLNKKIQVSGSGELAWERRFEFLTVEGNVFYYFVEKASR